MLTKLFKDCQTTLDIRLRQYLAVNTRQNDRLRQIGIDNWILRTENQGSNHKQEENKYFQRKLFQ